MQVLWLAYAIRGRIPLEGEAIVMESLLVEG